MNQSMQIPVLHEIGFTSVKILDIVVLGIKAHIRITEI